MNVTVSAVGGGTVAEYSPMKRGLKGFCGAGDARAPQMVAEYSPMKRGLKVIRNLNILICHLIVAEYSPMKRGLKGN